MNGRTRIPRVLRETTSFVLLPDNIRQEGIFRVPPHAKLNEILREAYNRSQRFIVWKEGNETLPLPKAYCADGVEVAIADVDQIDAYGVAMATGLIKTWYRELRQPLFPQHCYWEIRRLFGDREAEIELPDLVMVTSPTAEVSPLPAISRAILTRHLLPLLARVESHKDENQMTAQNLAICFGPTLLCGPDQLEDMKMSSLVSRYLEAAIRSWTHELRDACGIEVGLFEQDLRAPESLHEYEDPLDLQHSDSSDQVREDESQTEGIILIDNDEIVDAPPLPPRRMHNEQQPGSLTQLSDRVVKRRPAPPLEIPPQYSSVTGQAQVEDSPTSYTRVADGFAPHQPHDSPNPFADPTYGGLMEKDMGNSTTDPALAVAKRKALPSEKPQAVTLDSDPSARSRTTTILRKPLVPPKLPSLQPLPHTAPPASTTAPSDPISSPDCSPLPMTTLSDTVPIFAKPAWPASSTRAASLPLALVPNRKPAPQHTASSVASETPGSAVSMGPPALPKPRTPSPGLLQRMPSFETAAVPAPQKASTEPALAVGVSVRDRVGSMDIGASGGNEDKAEERLQPRRLVMRERSVDDLRRLYEERVGTVQGLVRVGSGKERERVGEEVSNGGG